MLPFYLPAGFITMTNLKFPCDFDIKVMGENSPDFIDNVMQVVRQHFPDYDDGDMKKKLSEFTKYASLTITIHAEKKEQIDNLYRDLTSLPQVLMAL